MKISITIIFILLYNASVAQTIGGSAAYNFLRLPASVMQSAAGGLNISYLSDDAALSVQNPSLLRPLLSGQLSSSYFNLAPGIHAYHITGVRYLSTSGVTVGGHITYFNYGNIPFTDAAGNQNGYFRPADYFLQLSASKKYLTNWHYGMSIKYIHSKYQQFRSDAIAVDAGIHFTDSLSGITAGVNAKNMGVQLSTYAGEAEDMPFDLQAGITKKLQQAPLAFSLNAHHLHRFDITYNDDTFNNNNASNAGAFNKIFNHFVFAAHVYIGDHLEATVGYNHLRRTELSAALSENGLTGFSAGARLRFQKLQILFSRSAYQNNINMNHFGLNLQLNKTGISL